MRIHPFHNLKARIDLGEISGNNLADRLVMPTREFVKSVTETISKIQEPKTYDEAINHPVHGNGWRKAIDEELWNLDLYQTWTYIFLSVRWKTIGCKWVFEVNYYLNSSIERYKTRLVAQRFSQVHGIDYTKTFVLTVRRKSLRIFLAIAIILEMIFIQMDIIGVYLGSALGQNKHPIFIKIPQRCLVDQEDLVCKILKSLYGLK